MTEASAPTYAPAQRGGPLDLMRFSASVLIVLYHYAAEAPVDLTTLNPALARGYLATDFFLILSGYVLAKAYGGRLIEGRTTSVQIMLRRLRRIWPAHAVLMFTFLFIVLAATVMGHPPARSEDFRPADFFTQLFLLQAWGVDLGRGWNFPSWSLSSLMACYAAFPLVWRVVARMPAPTVLSAGLLAVMSVDLVAKATLGSPMFDLPFFLGIIRAAPLFLVGLGIARMTEDRPLPNKWAGALWKVALVGFGALQTIGRADLLSIILIGLAVVACGSIREQRASPAVASLASLSFSLFLTHVLTATIWFNGVTPLFRNAPETIRWAVWALALPAALAAATLFHYLVDLPLQKVIDQVTRRGRERRADPSRVKNSAGGVKEVLAR